MVEFWKFVALEPDSRSSMDLDVGPWPPSVSSIVGSRHVSLVVRLCSDFLRTNAYSGFFSFCLMFLSLSLSFSFFPTSYEALLNLSPIHIHTLITTYNLWLFNLLTIHSFVFYFTYLECCGFSPFLLSLPSDVSSGCFFFGLSFRIFWEVVAY